MKYSKFADIVGLDNLARMPTMVIVQLSHFPTKLLVRHP